MRFSRWILSVAVLASLSPIAFGQTSDWGILRQLVPGQKVKVETADGKTHVGKVESTTDGVLQLRKDQLLQRQDVQRVSIWNSGHHGRNALVGLGAGAAFGIAAGASCGTDSIVSRGQCMAVGAPLFGGVGAGIGALLPSHGGWREIYRISLP